MDILAKRCRNVHTPSFEALTIISGRFCMNNEKMNLWRQRIAKCQKSNLTVTEWCAQHQLSKGTYYYWYKKIVQQDDPENNIPVFADVTPVLIKEASVSSTDLTISWNQLQINVSNTKEAELAAVFISKLQSLC